MTRNQLQGWQYGDKIFESIEDFPAEAFGFVYCIRCLHTNHYYIGKKFLYHSLKKKISKKAKALLEGKGRKPVFETVKKESDWKSYWGSSKQLHTELQTYGEEGFKRTILNFGYNKKHLTYLEVKYQFEFNVLEDGTSLNDNILGKFYRKDVV